MSIPDQKLHYILGYLKQAAKSKTGVSPDECTRLVDAAFLAEDGLSMADHMTASRMASPPPLYAGREAELVRDVQTCSMSVGLGRDEREYIESRNRLADTVNDRGPLDTARQRYEDGPWTSDMEEYRAALLALWDFRNRPREPNQSGFSYKQEKDIGS